LVKQEEEMNILLRTIWMPNSIYESIPVILFLFGGITLLFSFGTQINKMIILVAAFSFFYGLLILVKRNSYRSMRD